MCHQNCTKKCNIFLVLQNQGMTFFWPGRKEQELLHPHIAQLVQRKSFHHTGFLLFFFFHRLMQSKPREIHWFNAPPSQVTQSLLFGFLLVINLFAFHIHKVLILPSLLSLFPDQESQTMPGLMPPLPPAGQLQHSATGAAKGQMPAASWAEMWHSPNVLHEYLQN